MDFSVPGELLILLALAMNLIVGMAYLMAARGKNSLESLGFKSYNLFMVFVTLAVVYLFYLFFSHNYAFKYVYEYSERHQPFLYILSAFWGGQEGTYLLWLFFNALFGYLIIKKGGQYRNYAMVIFSVINLFLLLILETLSPFALLPFDAPDGLGLNPLLRDPWMIIHPPVIFVGYAMAAVPFAIVMAALIKNDHTDWLKRIFPWAAIVALALGAGNVLGGYWAYKTLGWGGYWGWDPVENSSFIPWIVSLALLHGLIIQRRSGALKKTNILLSAFVFLLVVYGTFLTRSGVLADFSVHSFTDLGVNVFLIGFMVLFLLSTLGLYLYRFKTVDNVPINYNYFGREFTLFAGMTVLLIFSLIILFWTSLPFITSLSDNPRAADVATYNSFALPLAIIISFLLGFSPFLSYGRFELRNWTGKLLTAAVISAVVSFGLFYFILENKLVVPVIFTLILTGIIMYLLNPELRQRAALSMAGFVAAIIVSLVVGVRDYLYILFFAAATLAVITNLRVMLGYIPDNWKLLGGQLTHFGYGVMLVGILASSAYTSSEKLILPRGQAGDAFNMNLRYLGMAGDMMQPNNELIIERSHRSSIDRINPQLYYSKRLDGIMRKPYIDRTLLADLYFAPEQIQQLEESGGLVLAKEEKKQVGGYIFTFRGFSLEGHGDSTVAGMVVTAVLDVEHEGRFTTIHPAKKQNTVPHSRDRLVDQPAELTLGDTVYLVYIDGIMADRGMVSLKIPGLFEPKPPDQLVLDISKKPLIILVWVGTTLVLLGSLIVFFRRRDELYREELPN
ncbi:MAG: cytochrome c biogenesis protein CcsA [candidate division Zixibacteria bacterium]|nr:cytochrome c biogenesis protein CcsA [candidate division Zixibacteria bacterium]